MPKEATARIKINRLLEAAGCHFFPEGNAPTNIRLEPQRHDQVKRSGRARSLT